MLLSLRDTSTSDGPMIGGLNTRMNAWDGRKQARVPYPNNFAFCPHRKLFNSIKIGEHNGRK